MWVQEPSSGAEDRLLSLYLSSPLKISPSPQEPFKLITGAGLPEWSCSFLYTLFFTGFWRAKSPSSVGIKTQPSGQGLLAAVTDIQLSLTHTNTILFKVLSGWVVPAQCLRILNVKPQRQSPVKGVQVSTHIQLIFCPRPAHSLSTCRR